MGGGLADVAPVKCLAHNRRSINAGPSPLVGAGVGLGAQQTLSKALSNGLSLAFLPKGENKLYCFPLACCQTQY